MYIKDKQLRKEVGERTKEIREKYLLLTQKEVAYYVHREFQQIGRIERGSIDIEYAYLMALEHEFGIDNKYLKTGKGNIFMSEFSLPITMLFRTEKYNLDFKSLVHIESYVRFDKEVRNVLNEIMFGIFAFADVKLSRTRTNAPYILENVTPDSTKEIGSRLAKIREDKKESQSAFGDALLRSVAYISSRERGEAEIEEFFLMAYLHNFQASLYWLYTGKGRMYADEFDDAIEMLRYDRSLDHDALVYIETYVRLPPHKRMMINGFFDKGVSMPNVKRERVRKTNFAYKKMDE